MAEADATPESDQIDGAPHPRESEVLCGQDQAAGQFLEAWRSGRMPHAWLLSGDMGVGKATFAYHATRALLRAPDTVPELAGFVAQPPDALFERIKAQGHGNLIVVKRPWDAKAKRLKTVLPIDEIRRLKQFFNQTASEAGWRICILDAADEMNRNAANALLKILEEPPERALFLVISHQPSRLLPTIRSRCRQLSFSKLGQTDLEAILEKVTGNRMDAALHDLADGSVGRALRFIQEGGLNIHTGLCNALSHPEDEKRGVLAYSQQFTGKNANAIFSMFSEFFQRFILDCTKRSRGVAPPAQSDGPYHTLIEQMTTGRGLDCWPELWDKAVPLASEAEIYNLSRQQTVLVMLDHVQDTLKKARRDVC